MEYELFRSKLKPSVDGALVSGIIRSSSSGLNSHRTAAMELIIEGAIQERRERMFEKGKNNLQPDPTPQAKMTSEAPNTSVPEMQLPAPAPAPQPPSQSPPNDSTTGIVTSPASASVKHNASTDSPALSKRKKGIEVARSKKPLADVKPNPSPFEDFVELECESCHLKRSRISLWFGSSCTRCPCTMVRCVGCGTTRASGIDSCTGCRRKFK